MQITKDECGSVLKLRGTLDISVAGELHTALRDFLSGPSSLVLDLSGIDACDTTALQLICSARKTAERSNRRLQVVGLSDPVAETSAALGLSTTAAGSEGERSAI